MIAIAPRPLDAELANLLDAPAREALLKIAGH
jgi:hypothetical protein